MLRRVIRLAIAAGLGLVALSVAPVADSSTTRLSSREFWSLVDRLSEPNGSFRSDNLLSNELQFQKVISELVRNQTPGGAYLGVGPEQNFTYIANLKPSIAFIVDIRRGNLNLQLLYKALFELSADRVDFVSLLFSKPRPAALDARSSVTEIFDAYANIGPSEQLFGKTLAMVRNQLVTVHGFELLEEDLRAVEYVLRAFFLFGQKIQYSPIGLGSATVQPTYAELMAATDDRGQPRGFLVSEEAFGFVKSLESRNLVVPVVGNFAGPKAIRAIGHYLREKGIKVSVFYLSNVEEYLKRDGVWRDFCENMSALPFDQNSRLIRSVRVTTPALVTEGLSSELGLATDISDCH